MNRELLQKPFDPTQIKQRKGRNGMLDYVEGHTVIARLNEAFEGQWSFEIPWHDILEERGEILVLGKFSAEGVVKMQFGASQITRDKETKEIISLGDDLKAAGTDALKKCATFLGVGLHLYGERAATTQGGDGRRGPTSSRQGGGGAPGRRNRPARGEAPAPTNPVSGEPRTQPSPPGTSEDRAGQGQPPEKSGPAPSQAVRQAGPPAPQGSPPRQAGNGRLDNAQHSAILALAKKRGLSQVELNQESVKRYGVQVPYLTYRDAAHFIQELQSPA